MGTDCSLYIFPRVRMPRQFPLGGYSYLSGINEAIGGKGTFSGPIPARCLLEVVQKLPPYATAREDIAKSATYWRNECCIFLTHAMKRWGADVPAMVYDENYWPGHDTPKKSLERLERRRAYRERKDQEEKERRDRDETAIVREWMKERNAQQYTSGALSFFDYSEKKGHTP